jgi:hypothetical protein
MSRRNICDYHDDIIKTALEIEKIKENQYETVEEVLYEVQHLAWDIRSWAEEAKEAGQSMENRLSEYRDAIEGLGFERK